jgi:poly [ADP-ribose] polymerase 10/14/15
VLLRDHWLQDSKLSLVPHYEVLEPEELVEDASGGDHPDTLGPGATKNALLEAEGLAETHRSTETVTVGSGEAPEQLGASLTGPVGSPDQEEPIIPGISPEEATVSPEQARLSSQEPIGSAGPVGPVGSFSELPGQVGSPGSVGQEGLVEAAISSPGEEGLVGSMGIAVESPEKVKLESPGDVELLGQEDLVEMVLPTEPGAMRFLQLYHEDLLASLGDIALFPLEGTDTTGFRVSYPVESLTLLLLSRALGTFPVLGTCKLSLPPWSFSSAEPWPSARQPWSCCRVCWAALAAMC